jgi:aminoglycoside 2'-N-acetyltransferase I
VSASLRVVATDALEERERGDLAALFQAAWPDGTFSARDWDHMLGGHHVVLERDGAVVSHAAVVPRTLWVGDRAIASGYVEAMATRPERQGHGFGTEVLRAVNDLVRDTYDLGALCTGSQAFYARLGWEPWSGPLAVRARDGDVPTPDEDGNVMILRTPRTGRLAIRATLRCPWRPGDVW